MRIASFNVENLFERAKAFNLEDKEAARVVLEQYARLNDLFNQPAYSKADKTEMVELLGKLGLAERDDGGEFALLRQNRGRLLRRPMAAWNGDRRHWARRLDRLGRTEDRAGKRTRDAAHGDGDPRRQRRRAGRRRGRQPDRARRSSPQIAARAGRRQALRARDADRRQRRSRHRRRSPDQGRYEIAAIAPMSTTRTPSGRDLQPRLPRVHGRNPERRATRRARQPPKEQGVRQSGNIEREAQTPGAAGGQDLPSPDRGRPDERDRRSAISTTRPTPHRLRPCSPDRPARHHHPPELPSDGRPGTFGNGTKSQKIDYVLLSPALFSRVTGGAIFRKGVWGGKHGTLFPHFPTITKPVEAASDHAAIYADID